MYNLIAISLIVAGLTFIAGEAVRRRTGGSNEVSRKLVHTLHGLVLASWAFIAPLWLIIVTEVVFLLCVFLVRQFRLLPWLHQVGRISYGDYLFPVGVIIAALFAGSEAILAAAILQLALADSAAAIVGKKWGHGRRYTAFGQQKSLAGSMAFLLVSLAIIGGFMAVGLLASSLLILAAVPLILTVTENIVGYGLDNALIPIITVLLFNFS